MNYVVGAFKLDHLLPVKQILFHKFSAFLTFILGSPIPYYPREKGLEMRKGIHSKLNVTQGFLYLGHSNWTICSLLSRICSINFPPSWPLYWGAQFLITPERKGLEMRKRIHSKLNVTQGFLYLGHSNWTICSLLSRFCSINFPPSCPLYWGAQFLITPERKRLEMRKGIHSKLKVTLGFCTWDIQIGPFADC